MEQRRKQFANEIRLNITRMEKSQFRDDEVLKNLKNINLSQEILHKKQNELKTNIEKRRIEISNLEKREQDYLNGKLDSEITQELRENADAIKTRNEIIVKKKKEILKENEEKKAKLTDKKYKNDDWNLAKDYRYYYKQFCRANESLPDYIRENLITMPNNKGYMWRNCWYYGEQPAEYGQPTIIFDKKRGGIMHIHEIDQYEHRIYEKNGKERKKLISTFQRDNKNTTYPIKWH